MLRRPPRSTRTDTLFPYTTLFRSFAFQIILEQFSGGIEHGHIHIHDPTPAFPYAIMVSLCVHAFLEAMPLQGHHHEELLWGISLHHIPAAFVLGSILLQRSEEPTSELQALMRSSYTVFCYKKKLNHTYHIEKQINN